MTHFQYELKREYNPKTKCWDIVTYHPCPFGERDLQNDECYSGNGQNRCPFFVRYDWEKYKGHVICNHPPKKTKSQQLEFEF